MSFVFTKVTAFPMLLHSFGPNTRLFGISSTIFAQMSWDLVCKCSHNDVIWFYKGHHWVAKTNCLTILFWRYTGKPCEAEEITSYTLKIPGSDLTRKRVPWGRTHSWVRLIWNPGKNDRNLSLKCLSDSDSGSVWLGFRVSLTWIPGRSDPKMGLAPSDSFPGQIWPGSF